MSLSKAVSTLGLAAALALPVACGKTSSKNQGERGNAPKNELSPGDLQHKIDDGSQVFTGLKSLRHDFGQQATLKAFQGLVALGVPPASADTIDVNSSQCRKISEKPLLSGGIERRYDCLVDLDGVAQSCTVTVDKDRQDATVTAQTQLCVSQQGGEPTDPATPAPMPGTDGGTQQDGGNTAQAFIPTFGQDIKDCAGAFDSFDSLYAGASAQYQSLADQLKNPSQAGQQGFELVKATPAADESVAYDLKIRDGAPGLSGSGRLAGGGAGDQFHVVSTMELTTDFGKIFQGSMPSGPDAGGMGGMPTTALGTQNMKGSVRADVDLAAKSVDLAIDMAQTQKHDNAVETSRVAGDIKVVDGSEKSVSQQLEIELGGDGARTIKTNLTAKLVDANTLDVQGSLTQDGSTRSVGFAILKDASGKCSIEKK